MPEIGSPFEDKPRAESPGEQSQKFASWLVMWCRLKLKLNLPQEALAQIIAAVITWKNKITGQ